MKFLVAIAVVAVVLAGVLAYRYVPWLSVDVRIHAERGSINCGELSDSRSNAIAPQAAIKCAVDAHQQKRPFTITFHVHGIDEQVSNAIVGDSSGNAIELVYATGMFAQANTLLRHRCAQPVQLQIDPATVYGIPRLNCAPWPASALERDHIFW